LPLAPVTCIRASSAISATASDLIDCMKEGLASPPLLVNLNGVAGLDAVSVDAAGNLHIGATVTLAALAENPVVNARARAVATVPTAAAIANAFYNATGVRAEAALRRVVLDECRLHRVRAALGRQAFDGGDVALADVNREHHARIDRRRVQPHSAGRTGAAIADHLGAGQAQVVAQSLRQRGARLNLDCARRPVNIDFERHRTRPNRTAWVGSGLRRQQVCFENFCAGQSGCAEPGALRKSRRLKPVREDFGDSTCLRQAIGISLQGKKLRQD